MHIIDATQAESTFDALLDMVEAGEEVVITRGGKRVAKMIKSDRPHDVKAARAAVKEIRR